MSIKWKRKGGEEEPADMYNSSILNLNVPLFNELETMGTGLAKVYFWWQKKVLAISREDSNTECE